MRAGAALLAGAGLPPTDTMHREDDMSNTANSLETARHATLRLGAGEHGQVLTCRVPLHCSLEDFQRVATNAYGLINKLTGCNCMSGRISVVVEDSFADVIRVNLEQPAVTAR